MNEGSVSPVNLFSSRQQKQQQPDPEPQHHQHKAQLQQQQQQQQLQQQFYHQQQLQQQEDDEVIIGKRVFDHFEVSKVYLLLILLYTLIGFVERRERKLRQRP